MAGFEVTTEGFAFVGEKVRVQVGNQDFELDLLLPDKGYSLTDCISMKTMCREGLTDVFTNHRHFEQEGFRALFRS